MTDTNAPLEFTIDGQPDFSFIRVKLPEGRVLKVEASAMATMDTNVRFKTKLKGGLGRFLSGESLFLNEFSSKGGPGEIGIAPAAPGEVQHLRLNNEVVYLQNSGFVAATEGIVTESKWQGFTKGFFSGESFFLIRCSGTGDLWFNTFGAMIEMNDADEAIAIDTGHIVAFTDGLQYRVSPVAGYKSLFFSGEGLVCRFTGRGKIWVQTRKLDRFVAWAHWYRPVKKRD